VNLSTFCSFHLYSVSNLVAYLPHELLIALDLLLATVMQSGDAHSANSSSSMADNAGMNGDSSMTESWRRAQDALKSMSEGVGAQQPTIAPPAPYAGWGAPPYYNPVGAYVPPAFNLPPPFNPYAPPPPTAYPAMGPQFPVGRSPYSHPLLRPISMPTSSTTQQQRPIGYPPRPRLPVRPVRFVVANTAQQQIKKSQTAQGSSIPAIPATYPPVVR